MCSQAYILPASPIPVIYLNTFVGNSIVPVHVCMYRYFGIWLGWSIIYSDGVLYSPKQLELTMILPKLM